MTPARLVARVAARRVAGRWLLVAHGPAAGRSVGCLPCGVRSAFSSVPVLVVGGAK
jgi:hypothetical protein